MQVQHARIIRILLGICAIKVSLGQDDACRCQNLDSCYEAVESIIQNNAQDCTQRCETQANITSNELIQCYNIFQQSMQDRLRIEYDCQVENGVCENPLQRRRLLKRAKRAGYSRYKPSPSYRLVYQTGHGGGYKKKTSYKRPSYGYHHKPKLGYNYYKRQRSYHAKPKYHKYYGYRPNQYERHGYKKKDSGDTAVAPPVAPVVNPVAPGGVGGPVIFPGGAVNPLTLLGDFNAFDSCYRTCMAEATTGGRRVEALQQLRPRKVVAAVQVHRQVASVRSIANRRNRRTRGRRNRASLFSRVLRPRQPLRVRFKRQASPRLQTLLRQCGNVDACRVGEGSLGCRDVQPSVIQLEGQLRACREEIIDALAPTTTTTTIP